MRDWTTILLGASFYVMGVCIGMWVSRTVGPVGSLALGLGLCGIVIFAWLLTGVYAAGLRRGSKEMSHD